MVVIQLNAVDYLGCDAVLEIAEVGHQETGSGRSGEREGVWNLGASAGLAEMAVANGWETDWVRCRRSDKAFKLLNQGDGGGIDGWSGAASGGEAALEVGRARAKTCRSYRYREIPVLN